MSVAKERVAGRLKEDEIIAHMRHECGGIGACWVCEAEADLRAAEWDDEHPELRCPPRE